MMMNKAVAIFLCALASTGTVVAGTLSESDVAELHSEVTELYEAFERGDAKPLLAKTHESLFRLVGGKDVFENVTQQAVQQMLDSGIRFVSAELGTPTQTYAAGEEEVCFVPRISIMDVQDKQVKSTSFMIAIRKRGGKEWKYLDGAGLRKNPDALYRLLPELERGVLLPPNTVEPL